MKYFSNDHFIFKVKTLTKVLTVNVVVMFSFNLKMHYSAFMCQIFISIIIIIDFTSSSSMSPMLRYPYPEFGYQMANEIHSGHYDIYYPGYHHNNPAPDHYKGPVPFGLPLGGFAKNGQPYGLTAYLVRGYKMNNMNKMNKRRIKYNNKKLY